MCIYLLKLEEIIMKSVIYARVSSREQEQEGYSIPSQLKLLNDYAVKNNFKVTKEFIDTETAKKAGRENFNLMVEFLKKNAEVKVILCEKTDRLSRNFRDVYLQTLLDTFAYIQVCALVLAWVIVLVNIPTFQIILLPAF